MISPQTPPGTVVCCINDAPGPYGPVDLVRGKYYTIKQIALSYDNNFVATVSELKPPILFDSRLGKLVIGFGLERFRYIDLPESLTNLLHEEEALVNG